MLANRLDLYRAGRSAIALVLALGLLVPAFAFSGVDAQERMPTTAAAAPGDAILYFELDLDFDGPQWQQTEELLARVGVPDALDLWREEMLSEGAGSGEFSAADLDALLGGEMAIVVTPAALEKMLAAHANMGTSDDGAMDSHEMQGATPVSAEDDEPLGIAAILRPGDPAASWDYAVRQVNAFAEKSGIELEVASGPGQDIIWAEGMPMGDKNDWGDDPFKDVFGHHEEGGFAIGHAGEFIIAAENPADVTSILEVIDGTTPSLAESDAAQDVAARMPQDAISFTYINASGVIDSLDPEMLESLQSLIPANMPPEALGGHGAVAVSADSNGFRFDSVSIPAEGVDISAYTVPNDPEVSRAAEQAPAGTFIFSAGKLPPGAFAGAALGLSQIVNGATTGEWPEEDAMAPLPSQEEIDAQIAQATQTLGFNPETDLFDLLGGEFIAFSAFPNFSFEGFGLDAVAAVSTSDPVALAETMQKIGAWGDRLGDEADISVRKVDSDSIYVISDPSAPETPAVEFGVLGDRAVIAIGRGLEQFTSAPEDSLAEDAQYQAVMDLLPMEYYQVSYIDISMAMAPIMMLTGEFESTEITDADVACAVYDTQQLAQAAYDEDPVTNIDLDQDFDGIACEDAFETTAATPVSVSGSLTNVRALAMVAYQDDTATGASGILYIAQPGS